MMLRLVFFQITVKFCKLILCHFQEALPCFVILLCLVEMWDEDHKEVADWKWGGKEVERFITAIVNACREDEGEEF